MFASFDPVALDQACADACMKAAPMPNSQLSDNLAKPDWHHHHDHFLDSNPNVDWKTTLEHAEKIGLGKREYELVRVRLYIGFVTLYICCERTPAYRGGSFLLQREQRH